MFVTALILAMTASAFGVGVAYVLHDLLSNRYANSHGLGELELESERLNQHAQTLVTELTELAHKHTKRLAAEVDLRAKLLAKTEGVVAALRNELQMLRSVPADDAQMQALIGRLQKAEASIVQMTARTSAGAPVAHTAGAKGKRRR